MPRWQRAPLVSFSLLHGSQRETATSKHCNIAMFALPAEAAERLRRSVSTTLASQGMKLANLLKVFADTPVETIAPMHVREYMDIGDKQPRLA